MVYYFKQLISEIDILKFLLDLCRELKLIYDLYQELLFALQTKNIERFNYLLSLEIIHSFLLNFKLPFKYSKPILLIFTIPYPLCILMILLKQSIIKLKCSNVWRLDTLILLFLIKAKKNPSRIATRISIQLFIIIDHSLIGNTI